MSVNDGLMLNFAVYAFLAKSAIRQMKWYSEIVQVFLEYSEITVFGQMLDLLSNPPGTPHVDISGFNETQYNSIANLKTSHSFYYGPVRLGLIMAEVSDPRVYSKADEIVMRIGHLFQVQDDFLDVFGDATVMGKVGTDIMDGKCSWLIVQALKVASAKQRAVLVENYGVKDEAAAAKVKDVFQELELVDKFDAFEKQHAQEITALIDGMAQDFGGAKAQLFHRLLANIVGRKM